MGKLGPGFNTADQGAADCKRFAMPADPTIGLLGCRVEDFMGLVGLVGLWACGLVGLVGLWACGLVSLWALGWCWRG